MYLFFGRDLLIEVGCDVAADGVRKEGFCRSLKQARHPLGVRSAAENRLSREKRSAHSNHTSARCDIHT